MRSTPLFPFTPLPPPPKKKHKKKTKIKTKTKTKNYNKKTKKTKWTYALFTKLVDRSDGDRVHCLGAFFLRKTLGEGGGWKTDSKLVWNVSHGTN